MTKQVIIDKLHYYREVKANLEADNHEAEIEAEVAEFRAQVVAKYAAKKDEEIKKTAAYIDLLKELKAECEAAEAAAAEQPVDPNAPPTVA